MRENVKRIIGICSVALLLVALMIVATFVDLKLSQKLFSNGNTFSIIFDAIGKLPAFLMGGFCFCVLINCAKAKTCNINFKRFLIGGYSVLGALCCSVGFIDCYQLAFTSTIKIIGSSLVGGTCFFVIIFILSMRISAIKFQQYKKWAIITLIAIVVTALMVELLKLGWGRVRYIDIALGEEVFSPWYKLQRKGGSSMPSGHTAMAMIMMMLVPLHSMSPKHKYTPILVSGIVSAFVLVVMFSRISGGYHFLSDVTMGAIVAFITQAVCKRLAFGKNYDNLMLSEGNIFNKI